MALLTFPTAPQPLPGFIQGQVPPKFTQLAPSPSLASLVQDYRLVGDTTGVINDRVMLKTSPSAPEVPMASARVWALRLADGYKAWEGFSDALGYYHATGLEVGVAYQVTAIDLTGEHKCTAGGPVVAVKA
ncbi:hypothetical protein GCM10027276_29270 [Comamonas piscis]